MARDAKIIQHGIDEQSNDLAVPAGTMVDSKNLAFDRDGVATRRTGHRDLWTGLPTTSFDPYFDQIQSGITRGTYDLFSGGAAFHLNQGIMFTLDELITTSPTWRSVPVNMTHRFRCHGTWVWGDTTDSTLFASATVNGLGRMVCWSADSPNEWQIPRPSAGLIEAPAIRGMVGNLSTEATAPTAIQNTKYRNPFDACAILPSTIYEIYVSDETNIRSFTGGTILAGSITATGTTDATGSSARFTSATWMATDNSNLYVVDNGNAVRKVTSGGIVTTLAGSVTASGSTDAVGTAARFTNLSGICYSNGFLYVTEGASAHRVRKIDVITGSVTIFAGSLTATAGFVDAVGTSARFNTPAGIEAIGSNLYVGDTVNAAIRRIVISSASVTTYAGSTTVSINGIVPGSLYSACLPSVTVRSTYLGSATSNFAAGTYLCIECIAPNSSIDVAFVPVPSVPTNVSTSEYVYHVVRSPDSLVSSASPPNKLDAWGFNGYAFQNVMAADTVGGAVFTTSSAPRILDLYQRVQPSDTMPRLRPLGVSAPEAPSCTTTSGSTFAANSAWAYRTLCGLKLPNGRIALGPPSERVIVTTGSGVAGSVTAFPSPGLPYDGLPFVQVYRTRTTASSLTDPGDTMFLCYEASLTYGAGIVFTDTLPDELLGAELYTNQYAFGAASASLPPPAFANEVASFNQQCVLSNFIPQASCRVKVLGVSSLVSGTSQISFTSNANFAAGSGNSAITVFMNSSATDPSIKRAQIASGGSAAQNAVQTARNIVRVINRCADAQFFTAVYDESDPGSFVIYSMFPGLSRTRIADARNTSNQAIKTTSQCEITVSTNASSSFATIQQNASIRSLNAIAPSDQGDVDSFPVINRVTVGPSNEAIIRTLPLAENMLVVKDTIIYRGDSSYNFEIYETALSCSLPNSFARLNNQWIGLFNAGFRALTSSQAVAIGRPIDRRVQNLYASGSYFGTSDFASAAAVDRQGVYLCAFNKSIFAYSAYGGGAWGTFSMPYTNQPSWLGSHRDAFIPVISDYPRGVFWQSDRRNNAALASSGYGYLFYDATVAATAAATVTASTSLQITFDSNASPLATAPSSYVGAYVVSGTQTAEIYSGSGTVGSPFVLSQSVTISNAASVTIYMPIEIMAQYAPSLAPGVNSQFGDVGVTLERSIVGSLTCTFYNRKDALILAASVIPYGQFSSANGIVRTAVMGDVDDTQDLSYAYYDFQRFATPADRSQDQLLAIKLSNNQAMAPLAIKAVVVELTEGGKVKQ